MKKIYILTLLICLTCFGTSFAQTLKGHIYDAKTNEPLVGAAVTYKLHGNQGVVSNINGEYEIKLPEGGVDLVFSYVGYDDVLMPIVINKREVVTKDVYMKESTKLLEEVVVSAGRFEQKLSDVTVSMDVVKSGDIARQAPTDISGSSNTIRTQKLMKNFYLCGDRETAPTYGNGLMAPRVAICAAHEANMITRLILGEEDV